MLRTPLVWPRFGPRDEELVRAVVRSGNWWRNEGTAVSQFEKEFSEFENFPFVIAVTNGTNALELALMAAGITTGSDVLMPAITFFSTWSAVKRQNAEAVLADVDLETWTLDPEAVRGLLGDHRHVDAMMPVHYGGIPAPVDELAPFAQTLIQDAAHGPGIRIGGCPLLRADGIVCWSFQHSKLLPGGEGGAVGFADENTYRRALQMQNCGRTPGEPGYRHECIGSNYRMPELTAALLRGQLERFAELSLRRAAGAVLLRHRLGQLDRVILQRARPQDTDSSYLVQARLADPDATGADRDAVVAWLVERGVPAARTYPTLFELPVWGTTSGRNADELRELCPNAVRIASTGISFHHRMLLAPPDEIEQYADLIVEAFGSAKATSA